MEKEPGLSDTKENLERTPEEQPNGEKNVNSSEPKNEPAEDKTATEESPTEAEKPKITFEKLSNFLGKKLNFETPALISII